VFGGTPGFLVQARALLGTADLGEWDEETLEDTPLEESRQRYCEQILLPRLYALLPPGSQALVSRLAVSELPLPADGLAQVASMPESEVTAAVAAAASYGLVQVFAEERKPTLYHVPGLIRGWLTAEVRLSADDCRSVDTACARFWKKICESDREDELQVTIDVALLACRTHAQRARLSPEFQWATVTLGSRLIQRAEWPTARSILDEIPDPERDHGVWHELGTIDLNEGKYAEAREKLGESLAKRREVGDEAGVATTLYNLSTIDLEERKYVQAREKLDESLALWQATGDCAGTAAAWHGLASIDMLEEQYAEAREKFGKALDQRQLIRDRAGEATTWLQLASIDVLEDKYADGREKFGKALEIVQGIGDRAGEAAAWHGLASIDMDEKQYAEAREKPGRRERRTRQCSSLP
jgi:tetratricopeptide (TPR) repeat protein